MNLLRKLFVLVWMIGLCTFAQSQVDHAELIKPLIEPAKLATLKERGANQRVQKITAILWKAKQAGQDPAKVAEKAVGLIGWGTTQKGELTASAMVRNLTIAEKLGATTPQDIDDMSKGKTGDVRNGPYSGQLLSVDHIIPRAVAPELDNVIANLELMPLSLNMSKNDKVTARQADLARKLNAAGLLSEEGLRRVLAVAR
jgi:hypothetical protein